MPLPRPSDLEKYLNSYINAHKPENNVIFFVAEKLFRYPASFIFPVDPDPTAVRKIKKCNELKEKFNGAKTAEHWIEISVQLGELANESQRKKNLPSKSELCEVLHAIRSAINDSLTSVPESEEAKLFQQSIEKRLKDFAPLKENLREVALMQLASLGHKDSILAAKKSFEQIKLEFPSKSSAPKTKPIEGLSAEPYPNPDMPICYQKYFHRSYLNPLFTGPEDITTPLSPGNSTARIMPSLASPTESSEPTPTSALEANKSAVNNAQSYSAAAERGAKKAQRKWSKKQRKDQKQEREQQLGSFKM